MEYYIQPVNEERLMTGEIQQLINKCSERGGGTIHFENGVYHTGTLYFKSNVHLKLSDQTIIRGSSDIKDYPADTHKQMYRNESHMDRCLVFAKDCENIAITGGTFEGQGDQFEPDGRPMMFRYMSSSNIKITGVKMIAPAAWTNAFIECKDIWVDQIDIYSRANKNGDGVDFDACENVFVSNSKFDCSDDCICVQNSTKDKRASNIFVSNCSFESKWAGLRIGLLSTGLIENIFVSNCSFRNIDCSGLKIQSSEGSEVRNIICSNLTMENVRRPLFITLNQFRENVDYENEAIASKSKVSNITIKNVFATTHDNNELPNCMIIDSLEGSAIENITLKDIHYTVLGNAEYVTREIPYLLDKRAEAFEYLGDLPAKGLYARNVKNLKCEDVLINSVNEDPREAVIIC